MSYQVKRIDMKLRKQTNDTSPILMTEEYWANSPLSIVRYYGRIQVFGHEYWIVDKKGRDLFECSALAEKEGREKAIDPGEPCDLVRKDFMPIYRKLGRDKFLAILDDCGNIHPSDVMMRMNEEITQQIKKGE